MKSQFYTKRNLIEEHVACIKVQKGIKRHGKITILIDNNNYNSMALVRERTISI
jgi:rRNA pseudouridine-1189 N-methylase Emg1 (Nep1/Mra1 family)